MKRSLTPEEAMNLETVAKTRDTIRSLQEQITGRLLSVADRVRGLLEHLSEKEVVQFLHAACEMDLLEARTYVKASRNLEGHEDLLRRNRVGFPTMRALAATDVAARDEALARMRAGATVGARDVAAISSYFRRQKLSDAEHQAKIAIRMAGQTARRRAIEGVKEIDGTVGEILCKIDLIRSRIDPTMREQYVRDVQTAARAILPRFEEVYGRPAVAVQERMLEADRHISRAYAALTNISKGEFGDVRGYTLDGVQPFTGAVTDLVACLEGVTSAISPLEVTSVEEPRVRQSVPTSRLTVIELCAGAGGMSLGLERAGYYPEALFEFDRDAAATLRQNRPFWPVIEADIRAVDFTPYKSRQVDLLVGGLPCQPYSIEGLGLGKDDPRDLLPDGARAVAQIQPAAFIFENVLGLLHARHSAHLGWFLKKLRKAGYSVQIVRMEAHDYGVPQERTRILIVGMRKAKMAAFRAPPRLPELRTNMADALGDLMKENGWSGAEAWVDARRNQIVVRNGVEQRGALASTIVGRKGGSRQKERDRWGLKGIDIRNVADAAPTQEEADRAGPGYLPALTLRMRARLQSFPDYWAFAGGKDSASKQIGNAVPPPVGMAIGLAVRAALRNTPFDYPTLLDPRTRHGPEESARLLTWAPPLETPTVSSKGRRARPVEEPA